MKRDYDETTRYEAWRGMRADELYTDPRELTKAIDDWTYRQSSGALEDLLSALFYSERDATPADNVILQHQKAHETIDRLIAEVLDSEGKRSGWWIAECDESTVLE